MDAKLLYWTGATLNMALMTACALAGVRQVRRGEVARHRRSMLLAAGLVVLFLVSYVLKLALLGREDLASWEPLYRNTLRLHELCVLTMLVGGGTALAFGRRLRGTRLFLDHPDAPDPSPELSRRHRTAGRIALAGAVAGILSASIVLLGMYGRAA